MLNNIHSIISDLKQSILTKAHHPYLEKYLGEPAVDEDKLLLLAGLFDEAGVPESAGRTEITAAMIVQIGLDTHERVSNNTSSADDGLKNRQLHVLAGDYYSGLYYQLLASSGNIEMIKVLSAAIKEINEQKIAVYQKTAADLQGLMAGIRAIEASLIEKLAVSFHQPQWQEAAGTVLLYKRLLKEREQYLDSGASVVYEALLALAERTGYKDTETETVLDLWNKCIEEAGTEARGAAAGISARYAEAVRQLAGGAGTPKTFVEEG